MWNKAPGPCLPVNNGNGIFLICIEFYQVSLFFQHMNEQSILNAVSIQKDVDGFHPLNIGRLAMRGREPLFVPCTPKGCIELLHRYGIGIKGKRTVVIGRSNIVGMPAAFLLQVYYVTFNKFLYLHLLCILYLFF